MTDDILDLVQRMEAAAEKADPRPWFTVDAPWRRSDCPTYVIAGNPDPHLGEIICTIDIDEYEEGKLEQMIGKADADLTHIATADPPNVLRLCKAWREAQARVAILRHSARLWYRADGTVEVCDTMKEVVVRRQRAAEVLKELASWGRHADTCHAYNPDDEDDFDETRCTCYMGKLKALRSGGGGGRRRWQVKGR